MDGNLQTEILGITAVESFIMISAFLLIVATGIVMLVLVYQKKQALYFKEKEQLRLAFEKEILESKLEIQEHTMQVISGEIHDNIGQVLSLAKLTINTMNMAEPDHLKEKITDSKQLIGKAIQDLRSLSKSLNTDFVTGNGLLKSIEYNVEYLEKSEVIVPVLLVEGNPYALESQHELILFRIFQEVINNIIKHANATRVDICLHYSPENLLIKIADNGQGFNYNANTTAGHSHGLGLDNIKNRSKMIGATFNLESTAGQGTSVAINVPAKLSSYAV